MEHRAQIYIPKYPTDTVGFLVPALHTGHRNTGSHVTLMHIAGSQVWRDVHLLTVGQSQTQSSCKFFENYASMIVLSEPRTGHVQNVSKTTFIRKSYNNVLQSFAFSFVTTK